MKIFLVGGAVRDELLNYPIVEHDWVVVGATPEQLLAQGYEPVGKDFPVFLHPQSKEEYALARTERKTGHGYTGFQCHASPDVTLEQDLSRRDLTINAMAKNENGELIDPFQGQADIENRVLRHVSPAFLEDPLRVLRLARFASRYAHLGFSVAPETMALMKKMVSDGELSHLVPERVWKETQRALAQENPAVYFEVLRQCNALEVIFPELEALFGVPQVATHHPEIDCGIHSLMALKQAAKLSQKTEVRFSALFHDIGKAQTPEDVLPHHYGHEQVSVELAKPFCSRMGIPNSHKELLSAVAEFHTHCHKALELKATTLLKLLTKLDAFRRPERFDDFLLCCEADARGRLGLEEREYGQTMFLKNALKACEQVDISALVAKGLKGKELGDAIYQARVSALKTFKDESNNQA